MFVTRPIGKAAHTHKEIHETPIEEKESYRWVQSFAKTIELSPKNIQVVTVCDREADIYEMFVMGQAQQASLLVRASEDRALAEDATKHLWASIEQKSIQGEITLEICGNKKRQERQASATLAP
jgi:hypothetical protein